MALYSLSGQVETLRVALVSRGMTHTAISTHITMFKELNKNKCVEPQAYLDSITHNFGYTKKKGNL